MKRFLLAFGCSFILACVLHAQTCDSAAIRKLYSESKILLSKDVNQASALALKAWQKAKACPNTIAYYESAIALSRAYYQKDLGDSAIALLVPVISALPADVPVFYKASMHQRLSAAYIMISELEEGLKEGLEALNGFEAIGDSALAATVLSNIALVYQQQNNFKQAERYLRMAEARAKPLASKVALGTIYNTMGILYAEHEQYDSAAKFFERSTKIREDLHDNTSVVWNYNNLGGLYVYMQKYDLGILYLNKALEKFKELGNYDGQTSVVNNLGELYLNLSNYPKAYEYFTYSRQLYQHTHTPEYLEILYTNFNSYYKKTGDYKAAALYADSLITLKDSLYGNRLDQRIAEMQVKFDVQKKDLEIARNQAELEANERQAYIKNIILGSILALSAALVVIGLLFYRKKRVEQQARLDAEMAAQKELRTRAILEAEEKERRRIAQDLHDGVGQLLSAAKLNLSHLDAKLPQKNTEQETAMHNALSLLDDSAKEVRAVSHNMMPNTLIKFGLASAIREFITKLGNAPSLRVDLEIVGLDERLENQLETVLYRVIQEVVNNIVKHAQASKISMQLVRHEQEVNVMIEDNGVGFDTTSIDDLDGLGLKGIKTRIELLGGTVFFDSAIGRGTTVIIDVPLIRVY